MKPLLEVIALNARDAQNAEDGGADRVELVGSMAHDGLGPSPAVIEQVRAATTLQIRAMVRLGPGFAAEPGEEQRLKDAVAASIEAGADGVVLGFLDGQGCIDAELVAELVGQGTFGWTFHRAIDHAASWSAAWERLRSLPRLDQVLTAGSASGVTDGLPTLLDGATRDAFIRDRLLIGGGLAPQHVPALRAAGVRAFHVGSPVREDGSFARPVSTDLVARWRTLIDATPGLD